MTKFEEFAAAYTAGRTMTEACEAADACPQCHGHGCTACDHMGTWAVWAELHPDPMEVDKENSC